MYPNNTAQILKYLYPDSNPLMDWSVMDNGGTLSIAHWGLPGAAPTAEEVTDAAESQGYADHLNNKTILAQIAALEATITSRRLREAVLGTDDGWLADKEAEIQTLREML